MKLKVEAKNIQFSRDLHSLPDVTNEIAKKDEEKSKRRICCVIAKQVRFKSYPPYLGRHTLNHIFQFIKFL